MFKPKKMLLVMTPPPSHRSRVAPRKLPSCNVMFLRKPGVGNRAVFRVNAHALNQQRTGYPGYPSLGLHGTVVQANL